MQRINAIHRLARYFLYALFAALLACNAESDLANTNLVTDKQIQLSESNIKNNTKNYIGKPHAPITMRFSVDVKNSIYIGQLLRYKIYFTSSQHADDLQVHYKTKPDLLIQNTELSIAFGAQKKAQRNLLALDVIPQQQGLFYIYLSATVYINGQAQSRSFAIPVKVGKQDAKTLFKMQAAPRTVVVPQSEELPGIISMPAIEVIDGVSGHD
jgi:hypothetical protein